MATSAQELISQADDKVHAGQLEAAIELLGVAISETNISIEDKAEALLRRAQLYRMTNRWPTAIADYDSVLESSATPKQRAEAMYSRGMTKVDTGDFHGAISDHTAVLAMLDAPPKYKALALIGRAAAKIEIHDLEGEMDDYNAAIAMPDAPPDQKGLALIRRGWAKATVLFDRDGACEDYNAVLAMPDASERVKQVASDELQKLRSSSVEGQVTFYVQNVVLPKLYIEEQGQTVIDPDSNKSCFLVPEAVALYEWLRGTWMIAAHPMPGMEVDYEKYLKVRAYFELKWPEAYRILIEQRNKDFLKSCSFIGDEGSRVANAQKTQASSTNCEPKNVELLSMAELDSLIHAPTTAASLRERARAELSCREQQ